MFKALKNLFQPWEMVASTDDLTKYFEIKQKLKNQGIKSRTKRIRSGGNNEHGLGVNVYYEILVSPEQYEEAQRAIS